MRTKVLSIVLAWLALWVGPARAVCRVINAGAVGTDVINYDGYYFVNSVYQTISAAFAAAAPGDTIYLSPGSYDVAISSATWADSNVVFTGLRTVTLSGDSLGVMTRPGRSELRYSGTSATIQAPAIGVPGCSVEYIRFEQTNATARQGVTLLQSIRFKVRNCWFEGNYNSVFQHGAGLTGDLAKNFDAAACSVGITPAAAVASPIVYLADNAATGDKYACDLCDFTDNVFDFSNVTTTTSNYSHIFFSAVRNSTFTGNTVTFGNSTATSDGDGTPNEKPCFGLQIRSSGGDGTYWSESDSILIADNTFIWTDANNSSDDHLVKLMLIGDPQNLRRAVNISNIRVLRNHFIGPAATDEPDDYHAFEVESLYSHANGDSTQYFINNVVVAFNTFSGIWRLAAGLQDNARHSAIIGNYAVNADTSGSNTFAAWAFGGARNSVIANNYSEGYYAGIGLDAGGNSVTLKNYGNRAIGNTIAKSPRAYYFDAKAAYRPDSLFISAGNISFATNAWVQVDSTASDYHKGLTWWRGHKVPPAITGQNGPFSFGDMDYAEDPSALKAARAVPYEFIRHYGPWPE